MPTPSSRIVVDCSNTSHSTPTAWRLSAVANPPMPPPAINTFMVRLLPSRPRSRQQTVEELMDGCFGALVGPCGSVR
jgi:hypothetical protein